MKKRLLSAALALAMVLTMLPLAVFAADLPPTTSVQWYAKGASFNNPAVTGEKAPDSGWYYWTVDAGNGNKRTYHPVGGGVLNTLSKTGSATLANSVNDAVTLGWTNIQLLGPDNINATLGKGITIDKNGYSLGGQINIPAKVLNSSGAQVNNGSFTLTIKDSVGNPNTNRGSGLSIYVGSVVEHKTTSTTIDLQNVEVGAIEAYYTNGCNVKVTGSITGHISMTSTSTLTGGKVDATDSVINGVDLRGVGATLNATNSQVGAVTLFGHNGGSLSDNDKSRLAAPSMTLNGGSASTVTVPDTEALGKPYSVTLNTNAKITGGGITLNNANINVNNSAAGNISLTNGAVTLTGSATGPASAGDIRLGGANAAASLTVKGTNVATGDITRVNGTVNVTVPTGETNTFGTISAGIANRGISGGVWSNPVNRDYLNTALVYQVANSGKFVYYANNEFQKLIDAYQKNKTVNITLVRDTDGAKARTITFMNGTDILTVIHYGNPSLPIALPSTVNGGAVSKWTEYEGTALIRDLVNTAGYSTPNPAKDRILNAQVTENSITKLVNVHANRVPGLTARLVGNVITLSGAVPQGLTAIEILITTDGKPGITDKPVYVVYDPTTGSVRFDNQTLTDTGMWITNDWAYLVMPNDTTRYSLNGSGLKAQAASLPAGQVHGYDGNLPVITTVTCSGTGWTNARKAELARTMSNDATMFGNSVYGNSGLSFADTSVVSFQNSAAVKEALNAVVAGISESQINNWILNAQNAAWRKVHGSTTPNASDRARTGYAQVHVVAYMAVTVSSYNTANNPGTMTLTLTPSYYVEVTDANGNKVGAPYGLDPSVSAQLSALRPVNGRALGSLTGDAGKIELTLEVENEFATGVNPVAHQGGTYAYRNTGAGNTLKFDITHTVGNALGTFVVDGNAPMVTLQNDGYPDSYYDTLQAAVDDAKDGSTIEVDANYKGSGAITVTGEARKFTIKTNGAVKVTTNVSGVVTELPGGNDYTVQLDRDNTTTTTGTVTITISANANGTTSTNVKSAKPGSTVTITATPRSGYLVGTPVVRTNTGAAVAVSGSNGTYSFVVPSGATSVTVTPSYTRIGSLPFTDVDTSAWYYTGVKYCWDTMKNGYHLMEGVSSTAFSPNSTFTRAQMVQILWNMKGRPAPGAARKTFTDVPQTHWAYSAVTWAANNGYADGYGDGRFGPDKAVKRDELAEFLWKFEGRPAGVGNLNGYSDRYNVPQWAQNSMRWAAGYSILSGQNSVGLGTTLGAESNAKRSEVAVTVMQFHRLYGG